MDFLKKDEFLKILKKVSDNLENHQITYQIPYCHIDKEYFNYIDIIISDFTNTDDLIYLLDIKDQKIENNILSGLIDNFRVNFIKTPVDFINITFYYYCWNFFPFLIKCLVSPLNLNYTPYGLYYNDDNNNILISKNLQKIFDFLDIDFKDIFGFRIPQKNYLFQLIINSFLYNYNSFTYDNLKKYDYMYDYNKHYYDEFFELLPKYTFDLDNQTKLNYIDDFFPESKILKKITTKELKNNKNKK